MQQLLSMKKHILGTHEGRPLKPSVVSFLEKKDIKVIQTKSWSEALTICQNVTFDLIVGYCNFDLGEINRYLERINNNYIRHNKSGASIILQRTKLVTDSGQFSSISEYLKEILPPSIEESALISIVQSILKESA
jgi:hypothetical protein